jgi:hypothetical protein
MKKSLRIREARTMPPSVIVTPTTLQEIRENAMHERLNISKTIAELTEISDEINVTVAFLKAQRGDR